METKTSDAQEELVDLLAENIHGYLREFTRMTALGYTQKVETWIEKGSSPWPNQDRMWRTSWVNNTTGEEIMVETW